MRVTMHALSSIPICFQFQVLSFRTWLKVAWCPLTHLQSCHLCKKWHLPKKTQPIPAVSIRTGAESFFMFYQGGVYCPATGTLKRETSRGEFRMLLLGTYIVCNHDDVFVRRDDAELWLVSWSARGHEYVLKRLSVAGGITTNWDWWWTMLEMWDTIMFWVWLCNFKETMIKVSLSVWDSHQVIFLRVLCESEIVWGIPYFFGFASVVPKYMALGSSKKVQYWQTSAALLSSMRRRMLSSHSRSTTAQPDWKIVVSRLRVWSLRSSDRKVCLISFQMRSSQLNAMAFAWSVVFTSWPIDTGSDEPAARRMYMRSTKSSSSMISTR